MIHLTGLSRAFIFYQLSMHYINLASRNGRLCEGQLGIKAKDGTLLIHWQFRVGPKEDPRIYSFSPLHMRSNVDAKPCTDKYGVGRARVQRPPEDCRRRRARRAGQVALPRGRSAARRRGPALLLGPGRGLRALTGLFVLGGEFTSLLESRAVQHRKSGDSPNLS